MTKRQHQPPLHCDVCLQQIPLSEIKSDEATDYVVHFCGLACYEQWQQQTAAEKALPPTAAAKRAPIK